jgi:hypothetical protein
MADDDDDFEVTWRVSKGIAGSRLLRIGERDVGQWTTAFMFASESDKGSVELGEMR